MGVPFPIGVIGIFHCFNPSGRTSLLLPYVSIDVFIYLLTWLRIYVLHFVSLVWDLSDILCHLSLRITTTV